MDEQQQGSHQDHEVVTFCRALNDKYCPEAFHDHFKDISISPKRQAAMMKMRNHEKRATLSLDGCNINHSGELGEINKACPLVEDLDLSSNALTDWMQIFKIIQQLKQLHFLNISHNPLRDAEIAINEIDVDELPCLQKLVVNNIKFDYQELIQLLKLFPNVTELHASLNDFDEIVPIEDTFNNVESLFFSGNNISSWRDIRCLGRLFPSLQTLIICENPIESVDIDLEAHACFPCLEKLSVSKTLISHWECLDKLGTLPSLHDLRFNGIPLLNDYNDHELRRQLLIARLPTIKTMNGGRVDESEREDAERAFIRYYMYDTSPPPRYHDLVRVHGILGELADVNLKPANDVPVMLGGDLDKEVLLRLNLYQTTIDFRKELAKRFNLSLSQFRLIFHDVGSATGGVEMKLKTKTLQRYHPKEGDYIELQRLDLD